MGEGEEELAGAAQAFELTAVASEIPGVDEVMIRVALRIPRGLASALPMLLRD
ncbi:MAG TPA: hypothetical protein VFH53_01805 [Phycisphaerae bacterium]|nr:hypothetical protein [Phycisphaerae bacterium]